MRKPIRPELLIKRLERKHYRRAARIAEDRETRGIKGGLRSFRGLPADFIMAGDKYPDQF